MSAGEVKNGRLDLGAQWGDASCKHQKEGACGGCYLRVYLALEAIHYEPNRAIEIVERVFEQMKADER